MVEDFVFRWEFNDISKLTTPGYHSPTFYRCNVPWTLYVLKETSARTKNITAMGLYLFCNAENQCKVWSVDCTYTLSLLHRALPEKSIHKTMKKTFTNGDDNWGQIVMIEFDTLLNANEGFIEDDKIIAEMRISATTTHHIREISVIDFSRPLPDADNVTLKLDDGTLHVCQRYLMWYSAHFASLFLNDFEVTSQSTFELENVRTKDFTEFLLAIFPSEKPINADTYLPVLTLADRFKVEKALDLVEAFLMNTSRIKTAAKLLHAETFKLDKLMKYCFNSFKTPMDVKRLESEPDFSKLSASLKASLLTKVFKLIE